MIRLNTSVLPPMVTVLSLPKKAVLALVRLYRVTWFLRTPSCRFYPSCSQYMEGCVERHGVTKGLVLTVLRLAKCHPLHPGGVDRVPSRFSLSFSQHCSKVELSNHTHTR